MMEALRVYIGWDARDAAAYDVCAKSLLHHASIPVDVIPLRDWELRRSGVYWRDYYVDARGQAWDCRDGKPFSTAFSFTRFAVPLLEKFSSRRVLFCDPDMMWRADVAELMAEADSAAAVACVQHDHRPPEAVKMGGVIQTVYPRKNWSSLMVLRPDLCRLLNPYYLNNSTGSFLHALCWVEDQSCFALNERWNWLEGWSSPEVDPAIVHFTRGTPDMEGCADAAFADEWHKWAREK